jgi:polyhydroxybutyrate depolymerase
MKPFRRLAVVVLVVFAAFASAQESIPATPAKESSPTSAASPKLLKLDIAGVACEALVFAPKESPAGGSPLVFAFHGHGGTARFAARSQAIHQAWPEAITVYPQGLPTPGHITDSEGKRAGWQRTPGDQGDRDLKFFDALVAQLKKDHKIDAKRIYSTGHSNGGSFTYILWETRRDIFAAFAPSGAAAVGAAFKLKPAPALHIAGKSDPLVRFAWQERTMEAVRSVNGLPKEGKPWADKAVIYGPDSETPFAEYIHPGGHEYPEGATKLIVKFFQEHARK